MSTQPFRITPRVHVLRRAIDGWPYLFIAVSIVGLAYILMTSKW
jgi:hypothetical protein